MSIEANLTAEAAEDFAEVAEKNSFAYLCEILCVLCGS